jgi:hypothetical protein
LDACAHTNVLAVLLTSRGEVPSLHAYYLLLLSVLLGGTLVWCLLVRHFVAQSRALSTRCSAP